MTLPKIEPEFFGGPSVLGRVDRFSMFRAGRPHEGARRATLQPVLAGLQSCGIALEDQASLNPPTVIEECAQTKGLSTSDCSEEPLQLTGDLDPEFVTQVELVAGKVWSAFDKLDHNDDGFVSVREVRALFAKLGASEEGERVLSSMLPDCGDAWVGQQQYAECLVRLCRLGLCDGSARNSVTQHPGAYQASRTSMTLSASGVARRKSVMPPLSRLSVRNARFSITSSKGRASFVCGD